MLHRDIKPFKARRPAKRDGDALRKQMMKDDQSESNDDAAAAMESSDDYFDPGYKLLAESAKSDKHGGTEAKDNLEPLVEQLTNNYSLTYKEVRDNELLKVGPLAAVDRYRIKAMIQAGRKRHMRKTTVGDSSTGNLG